jgi:argininosuccinate lyase
MESQVSGFLAEAMAPEVQKGLMEPALRRTFAPQLPLTTEINKAHVLMLLDRGIISADVAGRLARAVLELEEAGPGAFTLDPALEDPYFNYEAKLIGMVGPDVGGRIHIGRSRNDLKSTQDRLRARKVALSIMDELLALRLNLIDQGERYADVVMPGYTHLQPAQPITYGYFLLGLAHAVERDFRRLAECYVRVNLSPLGAAALAGTSFAISRTSTAEALGFDGIVHHAQDAVGNRDAVIELLSSASLLASSIGRLAQDFYVMTTYEFQTLHLPDSIAITSSIMPQKKNMAALENLKGRVAIMTGALVTALAAYKAVPFSHAQDGTMDGMRWTWEALEEFAGMLPVASLVVARAEPRRERMLELARANFSTVTDLADALVRETALSFREAHHIVGRVVRLAMARGLKAEEITTDLLNQAARETVGHDIRFSADALRDSLDPARAVEGRAGTGSPARSDVLGMAERLRRSLETDRQELTARQERISKAKARLEADFADLARSNRA